MQQQQQTQKPLVVLDLNGVLLHTQRRPVKSPRKPDFVINNANYVYLRPQVREFLQLAFQHFRVAIWTSRKRHNALPMVAKLLTESQHRQLLFLWTRDECIVNEQTYASIKSTKRLLQHFGDTWDASQIAIVDDSAEKMDSLQCYVPIEPYKNVDEIYGENGLQELMKRLIDRFY